jgi:hypothetical protein
VSERRSSRGRRRSTALAVLGVGAIVSLTGGAGGMFAEFPAFAFVALCAYLLSAVLLSVIAVVGVVVDLVVRLATRSAHS